MQDPVALNSGWEALQKGGMAWHGERVSKARDATAATARYGTAGFDPQDQRRLDVLDRRIARDIMKQDLRRQKANRIHTEALVCAPWQEALCLLVCDSEICFCFFGG